MPGTRKKTVFITTWRGSTSTPGIAASPSASRRALSWSWASRSLFLSATRPAAARTPLCRMPPPSILRMRRTRATNPARPATTEPTGAPSPLDRQNCTESACAAIRSAGVPLLTAALKILAPSRWTARPVRRASSETSRR
ncbi:hypothetical protein GCM10022224_052470 [Nonomuraea antimicrobica]|uniref:Uncharacterized protein n=1 Tax=Nonomuraea antimicrobica TaxID=561173 RepID=A0ABP7C9E4_9ACTN